MHAGRVVASAALSGEAGAPYAPGLLALREGALLEAGCRALDVAVDVVLVDATGSDHPRRAGLALHLGAVLELPTVGVTDRTLQATATVPGPERGAWADLRLDDELVGYSLRTRQGARPVFVHAAWRTTPDVARDLVMSVPAQARTPMPLREARRIARRLRAGDL